jgi:hypothetical protein
VTILAHLARDGPGSQCCAQAETRQERRILRQRSIDLPNHAPAPVAVGDETSLGLHLAQTATVPHPPTGIFEVHDADAATAALAHHNSLPATFITQQPEDGHLDELGATVIDTLTAQPDTTLCLTGRTQTITALRRKLKNAGPRHRTAAVKAYFDINRAGPASTEHPNSAVRRTQAPHDPPAAATRQPEPRRVWWRLSTKPGGVHSVVGERIGGGWSRRVDRRRLSRRHRPGRALCPVWDISGTASLHPTTAPRRFWST